MPAGHVHTKASVTLTIGFLMGAVLFWDMRGLLYAVGSVVGIFITPDCDVDAGFSTDKHIRKKVGIVAEKIWDGIWYLYRRSIKHGSELSHFPVLGTLGRVVYIFFLVILVPHVLFHWTFQPAWDLWYAVGVYWSEMWNQPDIIIGLICADTIHYVLDQVDLVVYKIETAMGLRKSNGYLKRARKAATRASTTSTPSLLKT